MQGDRLFDRSSTNILQSDLQWHFFSQMPVEREQRHAARIVHNGSKFQIGHGVEREAQILATPGIDIRGRRRSGITPSISTEQHPLHSYRGFQSIRFEAFHRLKHRMAFGFQQISTVENESDCEAFAGGEQPQPRFRRWQHAVFLVATPRCAGIINVIARVPCAWKLSIHRRRPVSVLGEQGLGILSQISQSLPRSLLAGDIWRRWKSMFTANS